MERSGAEKAKGKKNNKTICQKKTKERFSAKSGALSLRGSLVIGSFREIVAVPKIVAVPIRTASQRRGGSSGKGTTVPLPGGTRYS
jgi:hypothetical protein